jgi:hypothetical protein
VAIDRDNQNDWIMSSKNYFYHMSCYQDWAKKKGSVHGGDIDIEADDDFWKEAVCDYFKKDLKVSLDWGKFNSQWKNFLKQGLTAKGIYFTLRYFYEIEKGDVSKSQNGIGIVPHIYSRGTCYWGERNQRDKGICDRIEAQIKQTLIAEENVKIIIQPKKIKPKVKVDLSIIATMEDEDD